MAGKSTLTEYNRKRDFKKTAEPAGEILPSASGNLFIVQKHDATRLHWDLRLEIDGVLKSWAVTKGPSIDPDIKRLAVRTEDHPMAYAEFEGTIPKGEYGGGTVMLWDRGTWAPIEGKSADDLTEGHLHFCLDGERMKGEWLLIRLKPREGEKRENWLLRKLDDEHAGTGDVLVNRELRSVLTGRSMAEIAADKKGSYSLAGKDDEAFSKTMSRAAERNRKTSRKKSAKRPGYRKPQLAKLVDEVPEGNGWAHEIKYDGYRALVSAKGRDVRLYTRNGKDWSEKFSPLLKAVADLDLPACLMDGEVIAPDKDGNPDFSTLQAILKRGHGAQQSVDQLQYHVFDLLELDSQDLVGHTLLERKDELAALLHDAKPPIFYSDHIIGAGEKLLEAMCAARQEGIISKRVDAPYRHRRSDDWLKVKCVQRNQFLIVGMKRSSARGRPFSSLLLAEKVDGELTYRGNVGTGFSNTDLDTISRKLKRYHRKTAPVEVSPSQARQVQWVTPRLYAEVAYAEITAEGRIRHGSFLGLVNAKAANRRKNVQAKGEADVRISSRDRVVFPDSGQTKGDLADYYNAIAPLFLTIGANRPISLVRCPQGRAKNCFYQKHAGDGFGDAVRGVPIKEKDGGAEEYIFIDSRRGLMQCVQMGTIEFHGWGANVDNVERPDRMIFDLDPDEGLDFSAVADAAEFLRETLGDIGLASFAMLSGGKGVHVVVPLARGHDWDTHKDFARRFAEALAMAHPDRFTASIRKAQRKGRIFIDWLRNQRGATAVLPYSARARSGAPVAAPVTWAELKKLDSGGRYTIDDVDVLKRRASSKSLARWGQANQELPEI
ncbi:MAG: DNA ligase D [Sphingomonas sp.]|nr:DNA ligase D [Sphingomonas sp.]